MSSEHKSDLTKATVATAPSEQLGPIEAQRRIEALDALRGFAILGIFMVNIGLFAMPMANAIMPAVVGEGPVGDQVVFLAVRGLFELKFVSLFSMMFGMGMIIQLMRAEARGKPFFPMYVRRVIVLLGIGFVHAFGLWYGDILFIYACVALVALLMCRLSVRALLGLSAGLLAMAVACVVGLATLTLVLEQQTPEQSPEQSSEQADAQQTEETSAESGEVASEDDADASTTSSDVASTEASETGEAQSPLDELFALFEQMGESRQGDPSSEAWIAAENMAYRDGPMSVTLIVRAGSYILMFAFVILGGFGFRVLGMFLLGMALIRLRIFDDDRVGLVRRTCVICLPLGLLGEAASVALIVANDFEMGAYSIASDSLHWTASVLLCLGYASGLTLLVRSGALRVVTRGLEAVGRMALTNYLAQTMIATTIFYWWGFGLFGEVSRPAQIAIVIAVFIGQLLFSLAWLKLFRFGPMEWLWRSLTYLRPQQMIRAERS